MKKKKCIVCMLRMSRGGPWQGYYLCSQCDDDFSRAMKTHTDAIQWAAKRAREYEWLRNYTKKKKAKKR